MQLEALCSQPPWDGDEQSFSSELIHYLHYCQENRWQCHCWEKDVGQRQHLSHRLFTAPDSQALMGSRECEHTLYTPCKLPRASQYTLLLLLPEPKTISGFDNHEEVISSMGRRRGGAERGQTREKPGCNYLDSIDRLLRKPKNCQHPAIRKMYFHFILNPY